LNIRIKSYLIILATFTLGAALGGLGSYSLLRMNMRDMMRAGRHHPHGPGTRWDPGQMLERHIETITQPDKSQEEKLAPLLDKYRKRLEEHISKNRSEMEASMQALDSDLAAILTPEQMRKWLDRPRPHHGRGGEEG
jgi:Spy/CpxP family protein refolding chaperone